MIIRHNILIILVVTAFGLISDSYVAADDNSVYSELLEEIHLPPEENASRALKFSMLLQKAGLHSDMIKTQLIKSSVSNNSVNVYAEINCDNDKPVYVISCHTDTQKGTTGIIDNWSGCVMAAALASYLIDKPINHGFIIAGFSLEEKWQAGSNYFVKNLPEYLRRRIKANINLECLGLGGLNTWSNRSSDDLERIFRDSAIKCGQSIKRQILFNFKSDADSFLKRGIPAITVHSLDSFNNAFINSTYDSSEILDFESYKDSFIILAKYLDSLDKFTYDIKLKDRERNYKPAHFALLARQSTPESNEIILDLLSRGSLEYRAGLRKGDIIESINGRDITDAQSVNSLRNAISEGDQLSIEIKPGKSSATKTRKIELTY